MKKTEKPIEQNKLYQYSFSRSGNVQCVVKGGSMKIWIAGTEEQANIYTQTGQAATSIFVTQIPNTANWILNLKGVNGSNTVDVDAPDLGTWNPSDP
jgi:hypothetical protein